MVGGDELPRGIVGAHRLRIIHRIRQDKTCFRKERSTDLERIERIKNEIRSGLWTCM